MSVFECVCSQLEVPASGWLLALRSLTECSVSECDRETSIMRRPWSIRAVCTMEKNQHRMTLSSTSEYVKGKVRLSWVKFRRTCSHLHIINNYLDMYMREKNLVQTQCPLPLSYKRILQLELQVGTLTDAD